MVPVETCLESLFYLLTGEGQNITTPLASHEIGADASGELRSIRIEDSWSGVAVLGRTRTFVPETVKSVWELGLFMFETTPTFWLYA